MEACRVGKTEMVELLINHGADPNTVNRVSLLLVLSYCLVELCVLCFAGILDCINGSIKPWSLQGS